jgi:hypothetical protein
VIRPPPEVPPGDTTGPAEARPFCEFAAAPPELLELPQPASITHVPVTTLMTKAAARCCAGMVLPPSRAPGNKTAGHSKPGTGRK